MEKKKTKKYKISPYISQKDKNIETNNENDIDMSNVIKYFHLNFDEFPEEYMNSTFLNEDNKNTS